MNYSGIERTAIKAAQQAKPGIITIDGKLYTLVFDGRNWVYNVYENGFWLVNFNTKRLSQAKSWLREYLTN